MEKVSVCNIASQEADPTISGRTNISVDNIINLLEFVLDNYYFIIDGTLYKQILAAQCAHL